MPKWTDEQRKAIFEGGKNIIVSAGAGSGKTAVLSERVLNHVKDGIDICDMLILTFTNAAAAEMKDRIRSKLKDYPEQASKTSLAYITTFDAYALSIVKKYNYLLNISDDVVIIDAAVIDLKRREILTAIFDDYYKASDERFLKLIDDFCLKDDKEVFDGILRISAKMDSLFNKHDILNNYGFCDDDFIDKCLNEYSAFLFDKVKSIKNLLSNLAYYVDDSYIEEALHILNPLFGSKTYGDIKNNCLVSLPRLPRGLGDNAKEIKKEIGLLIKELGEHTKFGFDDLKNQVLSTKVYSDIICEIILKLDKEVSLFKESKGAYEFNDIALMAISILKDNKFVRDEIKYKYKEILIDEYQDTNDLQDIFISFIENNNVYMVGDIKQSIYRFRNANPLLFKNKYDDYSKGLDGFKIDLNKNFRSRLEVTNNINLIFNLLMDDEIGGADYLSSHQMIFGNHSYDLVNHENYNMEILNYDSFDDKSFSDKEIEIFTIASDIKKKILNKYKVMDKDTGLERDVVYSDFVILMDRSTTFLDYKKVFEYLNIPLTIYRDAVISNSDLLLVIKNLFNIIIKIYDKVYDDSFKYSIVSVLRSFIYDVSDDEILKIMVDNKFFETDLFLKCRDIVSDFEVINIRDIYDRIIDSFDFYEKFITTGDVESQIITLDSIGKVVDNCLVLGYGPREFLNYLIDVGDKKLDIKLSLNKDNSNSVKIMTIHASKGLEYGVCYYGGVSSKFNFDDLKSKFYFSKDYGIIMPYFEGGLKNTFLKTLLRNSYYKEEISEKLRLFYVALTRAREKIIIVGKFSPNILAFKDGSCINNEVRGKYLSFGSMLNSIYDYLKPYMVTVDKSLIGLSKDYNFSKSFDLSDLSISGDKILVEDFDFDNEVIDVSKFSKNEHVLFSKEDKASTSLGTKMHYLFEVTDFCNPDYSVMNDFEKDCISSLLSLIDLNYINIYKEYEFIYNDRHGFIDLLIEYDDKFCLIDYKLKNVSDEAYVGQLQGYKDYVNSISDKDVYVYLYSILDKKLFSISLK